MLLLHQMGNKVKSAGTRALWPFHYVYAAQKTQPTQWFGDIRWWKSAFARYWIPPVALQGSLLARHESF